MRLPTHLRLGLLMCALVGAGCSLRPAPRAPASIYDMGPHPVPAPVTDNLLDEVIVVHDPTAAPWLAGRQMRYRLAYDDPARVRRYANSHWAASPVDLVGDHLRTMLAAQTRRGSAVADYGLVADHHVRLHVEALEQVFDTRTRSRGVVRLRAAVLGQRERAFLEQRTFASEAVAPSPDARGGVTAIRNAVADAVATATAWIVDVARRDSSGSTAAEPVEAGREP